MSRDCIQVHGAWPGCRIWFMFLSLPTSPSLVWFTRKTSCLFTVNVLSVRFVSLSDPDPTGPSHLPHPASLMTWPDHRMKAPPPYLDSLPTSHAPWQVSINGPKSRSPVACLLYKSSRLSLSPGALVKHRFCPVLQALQMKRKAPSTRACRRGKKMSNRSSVGHAKGLCPPPPWYENQPCHAENQNCRENESRSR